MASLVTVIGQTFFALQTTNESIFSLDPNPGYFNQNFKPRPATRRDFAPPRCQRESRNNDGITKEGLSTSLHRPTFFTKKSKTTEVLSCHLILIGERVETTKLGRKIERNQALWRKDALKVV